MSLDSFLVKPGCYASMHTKSTYFVRLLYTIRYDTIEEFNVDSKDEYTS